MNINFNDTTYQALCLLATEKGQSVAAYISDRMDDHAREHVDVQYRLKSAPPGVALSQSVNIAV